MPTFMTQAQFERLMAVRNNLQGAVVGKAHVAKPFVPWVGQKLKSTGGVYFVGIGTDGDWGNGCGDDFKALTRYTEKIAQASHERDNSPFWSFLDTLTKEIFQRPRNLAAESWGWSNLLKLAQSNSAPDYWDSKIIDSQREICREILKDEFSQLKNSLVVIASNNTWNVMDVGGLCGPDKEAEESGVWLYRYNEPEQNLWIAHGYHPKAARLGKFFDGYAETIISIARKNFDWAQFP